MVRISYPHTNYLCDEGNDPYLKQICNELGVIHVTRGEKTHAKAGNINNALRQATGEIVVILDPDHEPAPYLLDRVLGYFEDDKVGFVQTVQGYRNQDDSLIARGAAEQSYHFYGPQMIGMNGHGTTQAIGANCVFRRSALDSIGGHAPGLAEDMHTSMRLYARGWTSAYVPEILTRGLVPSTLPAFFKQQLKWSCGVFDLLFQEYPLLFKGFTFRQRIHFLLSPLFFLRGVIGLMEILVPLLCLAFGFVAWRATFGQILFWFLPALGISTLIHLRVQRWLLEPEERGMHLAGGLLTAATWWVYLAGFLCAVFRIKVPYIPTPKEGQATNAIGISIPNVVIALVLIAAVATGVYFDSSPSMLFMAAIAMVNAAALLIISAAAQQRAVQPILRAIRSLSFSRMLQACGDKLSWIYQTAIGRLREGHLVPLIYLAAIVSTCAALMPIPTKKPLGPRALSTQPIDVGGFYTGVSLATDDPALEAQSLASIEQNANFKFRMVATDQRWNVPFSDALLQQIRRTGAVPVVNWLPELQDGKPVLNAIRNGTFDGYLNACAHQLRLFGEPVLISFAPHQDEPGLAWSQTPGGSNSAIDFAEAWKRIAVIFREEGAANVSWIWRPGTTAAITSENPLELEYVNWIAVPAPNQTGFTAQYEAFRSRIQKWHLPVMIDSILMPPSGASTTPLNEVAANLPRYPEIKAVMVNPSEPAGPADAAELHSVLNASPLAQGCVQPTDSALPRWFELHPVHQPSPCVRGEPGNFSLVVDNEPFYVKGVVYNAGHDWRDAQLPLTRREVDRDFAAIEAMGGNTVRRYGSNFSNRNLFNSAADHHLKVMYGFWLPQDADYLTDRQMLDKWQNQVESTVRTYRHHKGLLGWCLGNEVWGLLKHRYSQPYLTNVRHAEVLFVDQLARHIRELDPDHPIFCAQESFDVSGAISDYAAAAPTIDVMCVNSYYEQEIAHLDQAVTHVDLNRPYLVSEFGPDGYWDDKYNHRDEQGGLLEPHAMDKAWLYANRWRQYIYRNRGRDVGGIAYCWSDRFEGTPTWFGLTDLEGRAKPARSALADAWSNPDPNLYGTFPCSAPKLQQIDYPTQPIAPNTPFNVHANLITYNGDETTCLWTVTGPNFATDVGSITTSESTDTATITLPAQPGWYRVQVKVVNRDGLDEASVPVLVAPQGTNTLDSAR
jgi:hypothetical protein